MGYVIIISANNPIRFHELYGVVGVAGKVEISGCLGDYHTAVAFIFGYAFLDDFEGAVGGAVIREDVLQLAFVILGKGAFDGSANILLPVVGEKYIRKLGQGSTHKTRKSRPVGEAALRG